MTNSPNDSCVTPPPTPRTDYFMAAEGGVGGGAELCLRLAGRLATTSDQFTASQKSRGAVKGPGS